MFADSLTLTSARFSVSLSPVRPLWPMPQPCSSPSSVERSPPTTCHPEPDFRRGICSFLTLTDVQLSERSAHVGFSTSIKATFLERRQLLLCFSLAIASRTY